MVLSQNSVLFISHIPKIALNVQRERNKLKTANIDLELYSLENPIANKVIGISKEPAEKATVLKLASTKSEYAEYNETTNTYNIIHFKLFLLKFLKKRGISPIKKMDPRYIVLKNTASLRRSNLTK